MHIPCVDIILIANGQNNHDQSSSSESDVDSTLDKPS